MFKPSGINSIAQNNFFTPYGVGSRENSCDFIARMEHSFCMLGCDPDLLGEIEKYAECNYQIGTVEQANGIEVYVDDDVNIQSLLERVIKPDGSVSYFS